MYDCVCHVLSKVLKGDWQPISVVIKASANMTSWGDIVVAKIRKLFKRFEKFWGRSFKAARSWRWQEASLRGKRNIDFGQGDVRVGHIRILNCETIV
jgi:hypothetical protein